MIAISTGVIGILLGALIAVIILKGGKSKLEAKVDLLDKNLHNKDEELKEVRTLSGIFQADISGLKVEKKNILEKLEQKVSDYLELETNLHNKNELLEKSKNSANDLKLEISNFRLKLESNEEKLQAQINEKSDFKKSAEELRIELEKNKNQIAEQKVTISEKDISNKALLGKLETQKQEIENIQVKFTESFKNLANDILDEKSSRFTKLNKDNLDAILNPLQSKINEFQTIVRDTNEKNLLSNKGLVEQIINLKEMNKQISDEANNLTKALKGDVKVQGNWGEVILERILEESGLRKGAEYETQASFTTEDGKRYQPDVIINLPDTKHLIVDSKVSLISYENFVSADDEANRQKHQKLLGISMKAHIDGLHKKHYHDIKELNSPDFVLLFMPIEGSFATVMQFDNELYKYALDKHIVIVSPSTLLATMRTIAFIWRQENQTKNAIEIARQSGALYDKFEGFLVDLEKIGTNVERTKDAYDKAVNKLKTGKGNLVGRAEKLKKLGAKASKSIQEKFLPIEEE